MGTSLRFGVWCLSVSEWDPITVKNIYMRLTGDAELSVRVNDAYLCVCVCAVQLVTAGISSSITPRLCIHTKGSYAELTFHFVIKVIPCGHRVTSCSQLGPIFQQNPGVRKHSLLWRVGKGERFAAASFSLGVAQTFLIYSFYPLQYISLFIVTAGVKEAIYTMHVKTRSKLFWQWKSSVNYEQWATKPKSSFFLSFFFLPFVW